jgi:hypothetical protein
MPFVYTSRHYMVVAASELLMYCNYPVYDFCEGDGTASWTVGGAATTVRAQTQVGSVAVPLRGSVSPEGHAVFAVRGGQTVTVVFSRNDDEGEAAVVIGAMSTTGVAQ